MASSWITGLVTGMAESGVDVREADVLIGTASGARVARAKPSAGDRADVLRRIGKLALALEGPDRRALVATQLPMERWPERHLRLIALDAETGVRRAFDRACGIELVDAVMATTASFGFAPVWFEGHPYPEVR